MVAVSKEDLGRAQAYTANAARSALQSKFKDYGEYLDSLQMVAEIAPFKPVYLDERLIGFATTTAHHGDVGGRLPGSAACDNTEIFQEGIRLPWLKLFDRGEPVDVIFEVIRANVRIPRMTLGDLSAQIAATSVAERALQELAHRYGPERLAELMTGLLEHTERLVRQEIAGWPDGAATFTDYLDSDGIERRDVPITATVTIDGDEITADLTESAPMVAGALNSTHSFIQACSRWRSRTPPARSGRSTC